MNGIWPVFSLLRTGTEHSRKNGGGIPSVPARTSGCCRIGPHGWELDTLVSALMTALPEPCRHPSDDTPAGRTAHGVCPVSDP